ncbi:DNA cytosine methyltransferase [Actinomadura algeriensis]|uniref:Cytosine-specific methyltransferase n=1 Tax=Actinomadura algeriensis TaxID=1679523 RepID=A0ABR9JRL8_9ACTN|nr:DNA cytosine methyltransferase [Actinomadura algeriensis]MBE1533212.1 DNA (cytosine-5)-methyltransferase 1 [Actinomadura algeriensis]
MSYYGVKLQRSDVLRLPEHPERSTEETFEAWCRRRVDAGERLAVDLFSGAGGLSLGLEQAGWTVAASVDFDRRALETHRANFPGLALNVDLGDLDARQQLVALLKKAEIDLVAGGPPCQPFSRAGRSKIRSLVDAGVRDELDLRKELWRSYLEVVMEVRPRAVLMENVPDMALGDDFRSVRCIVDRLEGAGYHTQVNLVDAWKYGVPQHRKRLIVLARRDGDKFLWPAPSEPVHLRQAIEDLPVLPVEPEDHPVGDRRLPYRAEGDVSQFARDMRRHVDEPDVVYDHMTRPVRKDDLEIFGLMTHDMLYSEVPARLRRYRADQFDDKYKRLNWDAYSRSITAHIAKDGYWYIHPAQPRTLTVREAARIQTFPDSFRFAGTRSDAFRQIGNAVPPRLGYAAASALLPTGDSAPAENRWLELHKSLSRWADDQRKGRAWYLYPGEHVDQAVALVVALLGPARVESRGMVAALEKLRGRVKLVRKDLDALYAAASNDPRVQERLSRVEDLTTLRKIWDDSVELIATLKLKPVEKTLFMLLMREDVILPSQGPLRVAARVNGSTSDKQNRLTEGRVEIARLIGGGDEAPKRMAALRHLSVVNCLPGDAPFCATCPLRRWCRFAEVNRDRTRLY